MTTYANPYVAHRIVELLSAGKTRAEAEAIVLAELESDAAAEAASISAPAETPEIAGELVEGTGSIAPVDPYQGHDDPEVAALFGGDDPPPPKNHS